MTLRAARFGLIAFQPFFLASYASYAATPISPSAELTAHKSHVAGEICGEGSTVSPYDLPFRLLLCLGFATTPSCTVCVFKVAFLLGPAACLVVFLVFKVGGGAESMTGDRVRKGVGDGKLRSTSIRHGTASRQEVEKSSPFCSRICNGRCERRE